MLRVEIRTDSDSEPDEIPTGTYKLNSQLSSTVTICESTSPRQYEGYITILSTDEIEYFRYCLAEPDITHSTCYTDERFPNYTTTGLWESIVYPEEQKYALFEAISRLYAVDETQKRLFGINRCILLHGQPGTGKSTLSRAIVHKLAVRSGRILNLRTLRCSQLFSRFYGESMKILEEALRDTRNTVILVDEADSLVTSRTALHMRNEQGDSLRMVNTLLGILDRCESVFIFTTNFREELDNAFLSRCDVIFEMKTLQRRHCYVLLRGLLEAGRGFQFSEYSSVELCGELVDENSRMLYEAARVAEGLSARELKKIVFVNMTCDVSETVKRIYDCMNGKESYCK